MDLGTLGLIGGIVAFILVFMVIIGLVMAKLYKRSTKKMAFVRTGAGGEKVIKDGGALIIPIMHEYVEVNMETITVVVRRNKDSALITKDKLRVDVEAEFYLRVKPDAEGIATAAQTLGDKTMNTRELQDLVEGKFVDALRSVAAKMEMNELHENRSDFVQRVQETVTDELAKNGLELETTALTGLDQTPIEHFNPDNAFDAEGLKALTEITELRKKERNEIEKDAEVAIAQRNLEATQRKLEIRMEEETATAEREREIAEKQAEESKISELARISAERETEEGRIAKERLVQEAEIAKNRALEEQKIDKEKAVETANIERQKTIEAADILKKKTIELAEQDRAIAVANKSKEQSEARAEAERARNEAVTEAQAVLTTEATATAEREKQVAVINEKAVAEKEAAKILVAAAAERKAAEDRAVAIKTAAHAEAGRVTTMAEANAKDYAVEAAGKAAINAALEQIPQAERELAIKQALITTMPSIIAEMAKPIGEIDSIRVLDMRGSGGGDVAKVINGDIIDGGRAAAGTGSDNLAQQVVDGLIKYKVSTPLIEMLAKEIGLELNEGLGGLTKALETGMTIAEDESKAPVAPVAEPKKTPRSRGKKTSGTAA